jgi:hypothetical protein
MTARIVLAAAILSSVLCVGSAFAHPADTGLQPGLTDTATATAETRAPLLLAGADPQAQCG